MRGKGGTMDTTLEHLEAIAREEHVPEGELLARALEAGTRQLWREHVLGSYLRGQMTRDEAIAQTSVQWVELAERQNKALAEDFAWAAMR
jgi:hypothetical protein